MDWYVFIPEDTRNRAYVASNGELAWPKDDALTVIDVLFGAGLKVLGVDVWGLKEGDPVLSSIVYDLDVGGEQADLAARHARAFIQSFLWDESDPVRDHTPFFNITVDSSRSAVH
jgi:hypothetical protein